jgi:probable rRNA maturation factor
MKNEIQWIGAEEQEDFNQSLDGFVMEVLVILYFDNWSFSVTLTEDTQMAELNKRWRNKEGSTDVLTFVLDQDDGFPHPLGFYEPGDIVISLERVSSQAKEYKQSKEKELKRVLVHGILHLKGMTHPGYDWTKGMLKLQEDILNDTEGLQIIGWNDGTV